MLFRRPAPQQAKPKNGSAPSASQSAGSPVPTPATASIGEEDLRQMWNAVAALLDDTTVNDARTTAAPAPTPQSTDVQHPVAMEAQAAPYPNGAANGALEMEEVASAPPASAEAAAPPVAEKPSQGDPFYLRIFRPSHATQEPATDHSAAAAVAVAATAGVVATTAAGGATTAVGGATPAAAAAVASEVAPEPQTPAAAAATPPPTPANGTAQWDGSGPVDSALDPAVAAGAAALLAAAPKPFTLRVPGSPFSLPDGLDPSAVTIRGRNEGVSVEIGAGRWEDILNLLSYRLEQSGGFFRNSPVAVDVGGRSLNEYELSAMRKVMVAFEMDPTAVRTSAERTFQSGLALGMAVTQVALDGSTVNEAQKAHISGSPSGYYIYRGSLRSGQVFYRHEHVIILGDVNPGAEVISDGDVLVWGRLRGTAHAGAKGNAESVVGALDLDPVQLRIDRVIGAAQAGLGEKGPRWGSQRAPQRRPEIARLAEGRLLIEPWDEIRSQGGPILKTRRN